ncbi:MAG: hypothetical protein J4N89_08380 [Chloroflexi bacterium]|nr:hypothetical protein [Chloroflexota bacterium]MCI0787762.1 hypothetical protein [Chloroflexota bacterium]MCI0800108.1 hypothetical protein [Chloroflexota bacterium]MCI0859563.1 hypothetical protein [Chloroflexota bacterium]MCI0866550.1 hypothetical protein [Chloroflexota bacterium]
MRITNGKVVGGHVIVEGEPLIEGSAVTVLVADEPNFTLGDEDEAALLQAIAEADRGELLDAEDVLTQLP